MNSKATSRTGLFLMELILSILFFSLAGAICIQLFVKSHVVSQNSVDLNHSVLRAQNMAEAFYGCDGNPAEIKELFTNCICEETAEGTDLILFFDEDFEPLSDVQNAYEAYNTSSTDPAYAYLLTAAITSSEDGLMTCRIIIYKHSEPEPVYELETTLFPDKETNHA